MKLVRILIYEGDEKWIARQRVHSLPDGKKEFTKDRSISVVTLGTLPDSFDLLLDASEERDSNG